MDNEKTLEAVAREKAQRAVDREVAARLELEAAIAGRVATRAEIADGSAAALAFIDAYANPTLPNPEPVAPDVAAPAPDHEPPVFTDVVSNVLALEETSGGEAPAIATELVLIDGEQL